MRTSEVEEEEEEDKNTKCRREVMKTLQMKEG